MEGTSVLALADRLRTEADAYEFLEELRWGDKPICPHCGTDGRPYFLTPKNGESRKTRTGSESQRRVWKCSNPECRRQFSVLTGTVFHGTKIPVRTWVFVIFDMCASKNGLSAREVERKYDLTPKSAWHMLHRLREAMKTDPLAGLLSGRVVADETRYGGTPKNRHGHRYHQGGQGISDKAVVMALVSRETGEVRSQVIPTVSGENLRRVLDRHLDRSTTHLHTDEARHYRNINEGFASHSTVNHSIGEYVRDDVSTNQAETFFSQLKRSLDGTHHHVSKEHLHRYLTEFDWRFSTREQSDTQRMAQLVRSVGGRRLAYRPPT
jgi:transposase-like protein